MFLAPPRTTSHVVAQDPGSKNGYGERGNLTVSKPLREETVEFGNVWVDSLDKTEGPSRRFE
jgi:hypothetical protein